MRKPVDAEVEVPGRVELPYDDGKGGTKDDFGGPSMDV